MGGGPSATLVLPASRGVPEWSQSGAGLPTPLGRREPLEFPAKRATATFVMENGLLAPPGYMRGGGVVFGKGACCSPPHLTEGLLLSLSRPQPHEGGVLLAPLVCLPQGGGARIELVCPRPWGGGNPQSAALASSDQGGCDPRWCPHFGGGLPTVRGGGLAAPNSKPGVLRSEAKERRERGQTFKPWCFRQNALQPPL
jgi:hypothetical protein